MDYRFNLEKQNVSYVIRLLNEKRHKTVAIIWQAPTFPGLDIIIFRSANNEDHFTNEFFSIQIRFVNRLLSFRSQLP